MTIKRDSRGELRDYKKEYARYQSSKKAKKDRAARNRNRRHFERMGLVHKGDGKEIDHKDSNPQHNGRKNLRIVSRHTNRAKKEDSRLSGKRRRSTRSTRRKRGV